MLITGRSPSASLTLDKTLEYLANAESVDGLALFGSRLSDNPNPVSDYDLLILVHEPPVRIFQMLTHIDGRMADVVFVETDDVDELLALDDPADLPKRSGYLVQKMLVAEIVYDPAGRLGSVRDHSMAWAEAGQWPLATTPEAAYATWFWQNHGLIHVKRMAQSDDPLYQTATEMMMLNGLSSICRSYLLARHRPWAGEKAAIRHLMAHDPAFLANFRACLGETDRAKRMTLFESLVKEALAPIGPLWQPGSTSVYLAEENEQPARVDEALTYWDSLLME